MIRIDFKFLKPGERSFRRPGAASQLMDDSSRRSLVGMDRLPGMDRLMDRLGWTGDRVTMGLTATDVPSL